MSPCDFPRGGGKVVCRTVSVRAGLDVSDCLDAARRCDLGIELTSDLLTFCWCLESTTGPVLSYIYVTRRALHIYIPVLTYVLHRHVLRMYIPFLT